MTLVFLVVLVAANIAAGVEIAARIPKGTTPSFWERHWRAGLLVVGVCVVLAAVVDA